MTACELRLPSNLVYRFTNKTLGVHDEIKIGFREFRADTRPADPQFEGDWAAVYCNEGTGYWKTVYDRR